jgi:2-amino-4-hydroxy-6-hydroxymethyldihydropteridine diphosphokinase
MKYHVGLGSNIGKRKKNLEKAISLLKKSGVQIIKKSAIYETSPVGEADQSWFLNQVLEVQTESEPKSFLRLEIEKRMGRIPTSPKGPRCIDIDILLAEKLILRSKGLEIPHPELTNRNFVLVPLKEIAHDAIHPVFNEKIGDLSKKSSDQSIVRLYKPA